MMNEQASAWLNAVDGLASVHARLKRVVILCRDALEVIRRQDGPKTLFYLDPPHLHSTRASTGNYAHEMDEADLRQDQPSRVALQPVPVVSDPHAIAMKGG